MDYIINLLELIKNKYHVITGKKSLDRLTAFITGYIHCAYEREGVHLSFLPGFSRYISEYYKISSAHHWSNIIQFHCNTEEEAFDRFYEHLDIFLKEKQISKEIEKSLSKNISLGKQLTFSTVFCSLVGKESEDVIEYGENKIIYKKIEEYWKSIDNTTQAQILSGLCNLEEHEIDSARFLISEQDISDYTYDSFVKDYGIPALLKALVLVTRWRNRYSILE